MRGAKDVELILRIFNENRKCYVEWKQIMNAVLLVIILAGACHYTSEPAVYKPGNMRGKVSPVRTYTVPCMQVEMGVLADQITGAGKEETETETGMGIDASAAADTGRPLNTDAGAITSDGADSIRHIAGKKDKASAKEKANTGRGARTFIRIEEEASGIENQTESNPTLPAADVMKDIGSADITDVFAKIPEPVTQREISGFICDERGCITGYSNSAEFMKDGLVVLPANRVCTGIKAGAFKGLEEGIFEIYIPANITYIEKDIFDSLYNLIFIEVSPQNTKFYSQNGILYTRDGRLFAHPNRQMKK